MICIDCDRDMEPPAYDPDIEFGQCQECHCREMAMDDLRAEEREREYADKRTD